MILPVVVGASAAVALKVVFLVARMSWPDNYFDSSDRAKHWVVEAPLKVLVWRLVPFGLAAVFLVAVAHELETDVSLALWVFYFGHIATTNFLSLFSAYSRHSGFVVQGVYLLGISISLAVVVGALDWGRPNLDSVVPEAKSLVQGFWTAVCVAILFAVFKAITLSRGTGGGRAGSLSQLKIDDYYIGYLAKCAFENKADLPLLLAMVAHESSNRPKFLRQIELFLFKYSFPVLVPRTLGIAQQSIERAGSWRNRWRIRLNEVDRKSLERVSRQYSGVVIPDGEVKFGVYQVKALANAHNEGSSNISAVAKIYEDFFLGENAVMAAIQTTFEDDVHGVIAEGRNFRGDLEPAASVEVNAPWAVRYGDNCYVQFKVSRFDVAAVVVSSISSISSRPSPIAHTFGAGSREFENGLFEIPAVGMGMKLSVVDYENQRRWVAALSFDADRDYVTVYE
ncbi:hypothetical protein [Brevibacterium sp. S111]|uniref:hypothetical protein n=1 Tax=unclassified Brevibacterium TaxID=2614124 RepID=UPI0010803E21|nr:hypothetical protein [Brevibacterium sp. S111]